jgi:hypothetical protein
MLSAGWLAEELVVKALQHGASVKGRDGYGLTPLYWALHEYGFQDSDENLRRKKVWGRRLRIPNASPHEGSPDRLGCLTPL